MNVIVLNADYTYIGSISWQASIVLLHKGKVEAVKNTERVIHNVNMTYSYVVPKVVRLFKFVTSVYKKSNVQYSKRAIFIRDRHTCQLCDKKLEKKDCTVDHVKPRAHGGVTSWKNCICTCTVCNNLKGDTPLNKRGHLTVKLQDGTDYHMHLKKAPGTPSVRDFINMKTQDFVLDDIL